MAEGFLGRWSQRKQAAREGKVVVEPPEPSPQPSPEGRGSQERDASSFATVVQPPHPAPSPRVGQGGGEGAPEAPTLTMDDVTRLTPESDFKPFVARDVAPEVRNAAMRKLFTDPHYNVMDGLDTYIDDYAKPDPLPEAMLRQMASAKFLKLFDDEADETEPAPADPPDSRAGDDADTVAPDSVAQSTAPPAASASPPTDNPAPAPGIADDHTDLRLQPNHATGAARPGRGTQ
jgi:hypothetical protein